jgi:hypothetical protein
MIRIHRPDLLEWVLIGEVALYGMIAWKPEMLEWFHQAVLESIRTVK